MKIKGAKHEILIEQDKYRLPAISAILAFFKQQQG
jgi:alpha-beta hydrolase superfamily lysophospholipase